MTAMIGAGTGTAQDIMVKAVGVLTVLSLGIGLGTLILYGIYYKFFNKNKSATTKKKKESSSKESTRDTETKTSTPACNKDMGNGNPGGINVYYNSQTGICFNPDHRCKVNAKTLKKRRNFAEHNIHNHINKETHELQNLEYKLSSTNTKPTSLDIPIVRRDSTNDNRTKTYDLYSCTSDTLTLQDFSQGSYDTYYDTKSDDSRGIYRQHSPSLLGNYSPVSLYSRNNELIESGVFGSASDITSEDSYQRDLRSSSEPRQITNHINNNSYYTSPYAKFTLESSPLSSSLPTEPPHQSDLTSTDTDLLWNVSDIIDDNTTDNGDIVSNSGSLLSVDRLIDFDKSQESSPLHRIRKNSNNYSLRVSRDWGSQDSYDSLNAIGGDKTRSSNRNSVNDCIVDLQKDSENIGNYTSNRYNCIGNQISDVTLEFRAISAKLSQLSSRKNFDTIILDEYNCDNLYKTESNLNTSKRAESFSELDYTETSVFADNSPRHVNLSIDYDSPNRRLKRNKHRESTANALNPSVCKELRKTQEIVQRIRGSDLYYRPSSALSEVSLSRSSTTHSFGELEWDSFDINGALDTDTKSGGDINEALQADTKSCDTNKLSDSLYENLTDIKFCDTKIINIEMGNCASGKNDDDMDENMDERTGNMGFDRSNAATAIVTTDQFTRNRNNSGLSDGQQNESNDVEMKFKQLISDLDFDKSTNLVSDPAENMLCNRTECGTIGASAGKNIDHGNIEVERSNADVARGSTDLFWTSDSAGMNTAICDRPIHGPNSEIAQEIGSVNVCSAIGSSANNFKATEHFKSESETELCLNHRKTESKTKPCSDIETESDSLDILGLNFTKTESETKLWSNETESETGLFCNDVDTVSNNSSRGKSTSSLNSDTSSLEIGDNMPRKNRKTRPKSATSAQKSSKKGNVRANIGDEMPIDEYSLREWKGTTPTACTMRNGYKEILETTSFRHIRQIRGDNYCALRSTLYQVLSQGITPGCVCERHSRIQKVLLAYDAKSHNFRSWSFANNPRLQNKNKRGLMEQCLNSLFDLMESSHTLEHTQSQKQTLQTFNDKSNQLTEHKLLEGIKLLMFSDALDLYTTYGQGHDVPVFVWLMYARDTSENPTDLLKNHINGVGDTGGLEQIEMFLLAHALGIAIHVYRLNSSGQPDFITSYPDDYTSDMPSVYLVAEDDRHYNVLC